jgi:hypothetical protein
MAVCVPGHSAEYQWKDLGECVWEGPPCLTMKTCLDIHYGQIPEIRTLFVNYLHVKNATYEDLLEELRDLKGSCDNSMNPAEVSEVYRALLEMVKTAEEWESVA